MTTPGTLKERLRIGITPVIQPRSDAVEAFEKARLKAMDLANNDPEAELRLVSDEKDIASHL